MSLPEALAAAVLLGVLATLAWIDARHRILPNVLVYPGIVAALAAAPLLPADGYLAATLGALIAFALFATLFFARPGTMGGGDVKLAAMVGAALGLRLALVALMVASILAAGIGVAMLLSGRWTRTTRIPYGPYISAGAAAVAIAAWV